MFCIGTEFTRLAIEKPEFWRSLIKDIRQVFTGKLIYAANWNDEYQKINFWDQLDFIGIQAYFPLSKNNNPNKDELISSWLKYIPEIDSIHNKFQKKILFTEMGYKSTIDAAIKPWNWLENTDDKHQFISLETQYLCYKSFFETIWNKDWFAGVHLWQIRTDYKLGMEKNSLDFSPQGKPAEKVIRSYFNESKNAQ